ncbi:hypothetical protein AHAS_Ahas16G0126900 [Arachis hypogaea]
MKEKCYVWATRVKTYGDGRTNEYDPMCTLKAQDQFILSKVHFASLKAATHIEAEIVTAMCLILNQQNIKRFQEEIYCLPPDIVNMAIGNHPDGEFLQPKTKKPFRVEDYPMFIPFLDLKKLVSHLYVNFCTCLEHWWIWVTDVRKRKFYILDAYHKTCPSEARMKLNKFINHEIEPPNINISGQKIRNKSFTLKNNLSYINLLIYFLFFSYDCAIYVMKWLDIIQPENIKKGRSMSGTIKLRAEAIRVSDAVRLSKPSSLLLSPYC